MTYKQAMHKASRDYLREVLRAADGRKDVAAKLAGCNRTHFYALVARHGVWEMKFGRARKAPTADTRIAIHHRTAPRAALTAQ